MAKLIDNSTGPANAIGNEALLRFIDDMNEIRARSGNRFRFRPFLKDKARNILGMQEHYEIGRPRPADTPSQPHARPTNYPNRYED